MNVNKINLGLQTRILLLVCSVVAAVLFVANIFVSEKVTYITRKHLEDKSIETAHIVAKSPIVINGLSNPQDEKKIQEFANEIKNITKVQFVVVTDMKSVRKSHPDLSKLNKKIVGGDDENALKGQEYVSISEGTLGKSLRAFVPIFNSNGTQVGVVIVGILMDNVEQAVKESRHAIYFGIEVGFLIGLFGAIILARNIKKTMFGLEPSAIAKILKERNAMLKSVREGIVAVDKTGFITLVNDEALKIFNKAGITENPVGKKASEFIPNSNMSKVLETGTAELDQEQDVKGVILITNRTPIIVNNKLEGAISTFRDKTEIKLLAEQLTGVKLYADALRAQTHEFMNKLQVILGMIHMKCYDELSQYIKGIANNYQAEIGLVIKHIKDPVLAGFILGKLSYARESNIDLTLSPDFFVPEPENPEVTHELICIIGNIVDNAIDAVKTCKIKSINLDLFYDEEHLYIKVEDTGIGMSENLKENIFLKGYSTKENTRGFGLFLVKSSVNKLGGKMEITSKTNEGTKFEIYLPYKSKGDIS